ncbi:MAG: VIT1/CCC1 transporter family protein [Anaerolineaceae bacterium]
MSMNKRLEQSRKAFEKKDIKLAAQTHSARAISGAAKEQHGSNGSQYIGSAVYGGLDGVVTTFAAISGVAGAALGANIVLIMGLANLLADGVSMAVGAYLSDKSEHEYYDREYERENWEVEHFPQGEKDELSEIYQQQGYQKEDSDKMIEVLSTNKKSWVDQMMLLELGLLKDDKKPVVSGVVTFIAFLIAGAIPLIGYLITNGNGATSQTSFLVAAVVSGITLFGLGSAKSKVTGLNPIRSGFEMLIVGGLAAAVAYVVGLYLKSIGISG